LGIGNGEQLNADFGMQNVDLYPKSKIQNAMVRNQNKHSTRQGLRKTKNIPTIILSSIITKDEQKNMQYLKGGDIIIAKPYSSDELSEAIDKSLGGL